MKKRFVKILSMFIATGGFLIFLKTKRAARKTTYTAESIDKISVRRMGIYEKYVKRVVDVVCATGAIICLSPIYGMVALLVKIKLGSPVLFTQYRPGLVDQNGKETIFKMYKFRTMTDEKDKDGNLLPDEVRLTSFGKWLRSTSLDELPEFFNIVNGTMSIIGPRPQLVRDLTFMSKEQRRRHTAKPGLTGLAQVNGRNAISWEEKLSWDIKYITHVSLVNDIKIVLRTVKTAVVKHEGITEDDMATAMDYGDYLLKSGKIRKKEYDEKQFIAKEILNNKNLADREVLNPVNSEEYHMFSVAISVYKNDSPDFFDRALASITKEQTIRPGQVVLVVDGPIPGELNRIITKYENEYPIFDVIRLKKNGGLGNALRIAVENAKYELIARMDSDDISVPERFETQLQYFRLHPEVDIVGGDIAEFIDNENDFVGKRVVPITNEKIREYMKERCAMNHVSVMYKKSAVQGAGGYKDWFWNEDYYLWIRMWLKNAVFANTGTVLVKVRVGKEMYQRRGGKAYFESERSLQKYMLEHGMINRKTYIVNVTKRWIVQKLIPDNIRGWIFKNFAREKM